MSEIPQADQPLGGKRIAITRAPEQSLELRAELERLGATTIALPMIEIVPPLSYQPLDDALRRIAEYDWLVVTSTNAVRVTRERMQHVQLTASALEHLSVAAVGASTAAALSSIGLTPSVVPEQYSGDALASMLAERAGGARVLIVRASVARDVVPETLRAAGAEVTIVDAYRTVVPDHSKSLLADMFTRAERPDAILFASSSAVKHFVALMRDLRIDTASAMRAVSIGPITSAILRESGWPPVAEAVEASVSGLVDACVRFFNAKQGS